MVWRQLLGESEENPEGFSIDVIKEMEAEEQHKTDSRALLVMFFLLVLTMLFAWLFKVKRYRFLHETGVSLFIGIIAGGFISLSNRHDGPQDPAICNITLREMYENNKTDNITMTEEINVANIAVFNPELFFYVLLPPIIFNAGYGLKNKQFFRNITSILLFALVGTTVATFITGFLVFWFSENIDVSVGLTLNDCLLFGALISATDPVTTLAVFHDLHVDPLVYALVFGESVLNDAIAIVLYNTIAEYNPSLHKELNAASFFYSIWKFALLFFGSLACGCLIGMVSAMFFKYTSIKKYPILETTLFVLFSYSAFLMGESFGLTGIVAIMFCGVAQAHYTYPNLSEESQHRTTELFELLNFMAENFIFSYVGLNFFTYKCHRWNMGLIAWVLMTIIISRAAHIFPISFGINKLGSKKNRKLSMNIQMVLVWAGLRGAIAFALAMRNTSTAAHQVLLSTTLAIVLITVVVFGGPTTEVLQLLKIRVGVDEEAEEAASKGAARRSRGYFSRKWQGVDKEYIKPVLSILPNGTMNTYADLKTTVSNYFKGVKEVKQLEDVTPKAPTSEEYETDGDEFIESGKSKPIHVSGAFGHFQPKQTTDVFAAPGAQDFEETYTDS